MIEQFDPTDDVSLERALALLGEDIMFPETPDFAATLWSGTRVNQRPRWFRTDPVGAWRLAALAAIVLGVLVLSIPGARSTVAGWLELAGIDIEIGGDGGGGDDVPTSLGGELFLGRRVSLAEAKASVSFEVLVPAGISLEEGPEIYLDHRDGTAVISLIYPASEALPSIGETGAGLLLMLFDPAGDTDLYIKQTVADTSAEFLTVNGSWGAWIEDGSLAIPPAADRPGSERPSGHVLIWEADGITIRMETNLPRDEALAIAERMAPIDVPAPSTPADR